MIRIMTKIFLALAFSLVAFSAQAGITTEEIKYKVGDTEFTGYLAYDDAIKGKRPGVIVVHEWWGHNDYARGRAEKLAALGYTGFAVDMYGTGKLAAHPKDATAFMGAIMGDFNVAKSRFEKAHALLRSHASVDGTKIAAIGYCMGGAIVLNMAKSGADLKGVASFHGSLGPAVTAEPGKVTAKIRVYNGAADPFVPSDSVKAFEAEMKVGGADYVMKNYDGVQHSFTNPGADKFGEKFKLPLVYNKAADEDSWAAMTAFFKEIF